MRCDATHEPELFWALRGGGGNFGVVTGIEFAVYPVEQLYAGAMLFGFERAVDVLRVWSEPLPVARRFFDAASRDRLSRAKRLHDPNDLFRGNHDTAPSW